MAPINLILSLIVLEGFSVLALPEESYLQIPYTSEDEDGYLYMDTRSDTDPKQTETRRRSTLDKNFARFGRADISPLVGYDYEPDGYVEGYARPTRSGEKSDNFIRFGRGNSDFVRFGRDPFKVRSIRDQHFVRFGRSVPKGKARNKREVDYFKRAGSGNNFVRFGRGNNDFMRFGRDPEQVPTSASTISPNKSEHRQSTDGRTEYLLRLLMELIQHPHQSRLP